MSETVVETIVETIVNGIREAVKEELAMADKLTPRQNEIITQTLCNLAQVHDGCGNPPTPEKLKELRRALVGECEAVTAETDFLAGR